MDIGKYLIHSKYKFDGDSLRYMISEFASLIRQGKIESSRLTIDDMLELNRGWEVFNIEGNK